MSTGQRQVCECPQPCAYYTKGFAAGFQLAASLLTPADPAERSADGMPLTVAFAAIQTAALQAIRQNMGEDYGPDAEEGSQDSALLIAKLLTEHSRSPEMSLAEVASLVAEANSAGTEMGRLGLTRDEPGQREQ